MIKFSVIQFVPIVSVTALSFSLPLLQTVQNILSLS